ncbi:hypothetical protein AAX26_01780 [Aliarcobacter thereius]|uniref:DUF2303 family protein n=1 Tax=Aliarcobacter thereius TaxID=544718 RepID=UPI0008281204|nr:DUF2303 family protein [Aliarcobacter thereius]OCL85713.1 hypothetical protein AAX26_01780 [Aliarcobacter thereius]
MLKEFFNAFKGDLKPVAVLLDGREVAHKDYSIVEENRGLNFKHDIARHVINQSILNKDDFINFVNEYKTDATKIFYTQQSVKAVFNYSTPAQADFGDSVCVMQLQETTNFREFMACLDQDLSQKDLIRILKRLESSIIGFNGKEADDMDIIEIAENLQASKNIQSIQRNTVQGFMLDAEVKAGNTNYSIPRFINFSLPVFKNNLEMMVNFDCELFLEAKDGSGFVANLVCYKLDETIESAVKQLTKDVCEKCNDVQSFMI